MAPAGAFAARFAEVRIDEDLGLVRVARIVSAIDAGRILNEKLARSQIIGGDGDGHRHDDCSRRPSSIPPPAASPTRRSATT